MQHTLSFAAVQQAKRHAKALKNTFPNLAHTQRLDKAAVELFGVRDYHELNKRYEQFINRDVDAPGGPNSISHCRFCDYRFAADVKEDQKLHRERHERFLEAVERLGYRPGSHMERKRLKQDGHHQASHSQVLADQVAGVLMVTRGWFDRSLSSAISGGYWKMHPNFDAYVAMIVPHLETIFQRQVAEIISQYGRTDGVIPKDDTYWSPR